MDTFGALYPFCCFPLLKIDEAREAKKMQMARLVLAGKSVIEEEDDLFDGLSPEVSK